MNRYFRTTLLGLCLGFALSLFLLWRSSVWATFVVEKETGGSRTLQKAEEQALEAESILESERRQMPPVRAFLQSWESHLSPFGQEQDIAQGMRTTLERLAQRKLGLVTDQATAPMPVRQFLGKRPLLVQKVSLRASGDNLVSVLAWMGEAESAFPLARVESWELQGSPGSGSSLRLSLGFPLQLASQP
jgi:hypothetical protein